MCAAVWKPGAPTRSGSTWPTLATPFWGDTVYGAKKPVPGLQGQCLHAVGLQFVHPRTGEMVCLDCPLPEEFARLADILRRESENG